MMSVQGYTHWKTILFENISIMMLHLMRYIPIPISTVWVGALQEVLMMLHQVQDPVI